MQSGPQTSSSSVISPLDEGIEDLNAKHDLSHFDTCGIDNLLRFFLSRCRQDTPNQDNVAGPIPPSGFGHNGANNSPGSEKLKAGPVPAAAPITSPHLEPPSTDETLLKNCLETVRPICEEHEFQNRLKAFSQAKAGSGEIATSVDLFNFALDRLRTYLKLPGLKGPSDCNILFHVNHPKRTKADAFPGSKRSPDVVIVSQLTAAKRPDAEWPNLAFQSCPPTKHSFEWPDILCFLEYEQINSPIKTPIPAQYVGPVPQNRLGFEPLDSAPSDTKSRSDFTGSDALFFSSQNPYSNTGIPRKKVQREGDAGKQSNLTIQARMAQCGVYASEILSIPGRTHVICMYIVDEIVWVWWFDRQGAIQSDGINFVQDAPRFLVLLLALQRFTIADWGFDSQLIEPSRHLPQVESPQPTSCLAPFNFFVGEDKSEEIAINPKEIIHQAYCLVGRGTNVLGASSKTPGSKLAGIPLVAKLSWPNATRLNEEQIVETALDRVPEARDHLPRVIGSFDGDKTKTIRDYLDPSRVWKGVYRVHRIVISERLEPITKLQGASLLAAWMECVICHYMLWEKKIQHRDLSVKNLMFRKVDGQVLGVVNDWDLSFVQDISPSLTEHTATIPFLALDLLYREYWEGKVAVEYRHDLESFAWIFIWVLIAFENGQERTHHPLKDWLTENYDACRKTRYDFLTSTRAPRNPANGWENEREVLEQLCEWLLDQCVDRHRTIRRARKTGASPSEEPNLALVSGFMDVIENALSASTQD